jgi:hypothetical protein
MSGRKRPSESSIHAPRVCRQRVSPKPVCFVPEDGGASSGHHSPHPPGGGGVRLLLTHPGSLTAVQAGGRGGQAGEGRSPSPPAPPPLVGAGRARAEAQAQPTPTTTGTPSPGGPVTCKSGGLGLYPRGAETSRCTTPPGLPRIVFPKARTRNPARPIYWGQGRPGVPACNRFLPRRAPGPAMLPRRPREGAPGLSFTAAPNNDLGALPVWVLS